LTPRAAMAASRTSASMSGSAVRTPCAPSLDADADLGERGQGNPRAPWRPGARRECGAGPTRSGSRGGTRGARSRAARQRSPRRHRSRSGPAAARGRSARPGAARARSKLVPARDAVVLGRRGRPRARDRERWREASRASGYLGGGAASRQ
jgi:hypothetical protein